MGGVALFTAILLAACGGSSGSSGDAGAKGEKGKLAIFNWEAYFPEDVIASFEEEFNCSVTYNVFLSNEEMYQKLAAGNSGYDVAFPGADYASIMKTNGIIEKLDKAKLPNLENIDPAISAKKTFDPTNEWAVPYFFGRAGIMVNLEKVPAADRALGWGIFGKAAYKGKLTLLDDPREVLGAALVELGYSCNSTKESEINEAAELVKKWKANIKNFDSGTFQDGFLDGSLYAVHCFAENVWLAASENQADNELYADKYAYILPAKGFSYMDTMVILKESMNKDLAYEFINYVHRPDINAKIADFNRLPSIHKGGSGKEIRTPNYKLEDVLAVELKEDVGDALDLYSKAWEAIRTE